MVFHQHVAFDFVFDWFPWTLTYSHAGFSCCGTSCHCVAWSFCRTSCLVCSNLCHCSGCNCIHDWCWGGCLSWPEIVCFDPSALWVSWLHHLQTARTLSPCISMNWSCWISVPYHVLPGLVEEAEGSWPQAENISEQGQILQYRLVFPSCRSRCLWPCEWSALGFCKYRLNLLDIGGPFFIESQTTSLVLGTFRPAIFPGIDISRSYQATVCHSVGGRVHCWRSTQIFLRPFRPPFHHCRPTAQCLRWPVHICQHCLICGAFLCGSKLHNGGRWV